MEINGSNGVCDCVRVLMPLHGVERWPANAFVVVKEQPEWSSR